MPGHKSKRLGIAAPGNGSREPFKPGNTAGIVHGASTPRLVSPLAEIILREYLETPGYPEYLGRTMFASSLRGLAEIQAEVLMFGEWMSHLSEDEKYLATGAQAPPVERWEKLKERELSWLKVNGLTPLSYARLGRALMAAQVDIAKVAEAEYQSGNWDSDDPDEGEG